MTQSEILQQLVESLHEQWRRAVDDAEASWKDRAAIAQALGSALRQLQRPADVKAFLKSSEWVDMRTNILHALAPDPDALASVVAALGDGGC